AQASGAFSFQAAASVLLEEEALLAEGRLQMVQPGRLLVIAGEERALYPVRIAALDHAQGQYLLAVDLGDALDLHLARIRTHGRAAGGAGDAGHPLDGLAVDFPGAYQWHLEVVPGAGIPLHEHVVGDDAQLDLGLPQPRPHCRIIVDVRQQRALGADLRAGSAEAGNGLAGDGWLQLTPVVVMRHDRQVLAGGLDLLEQCQQIIGILVGDKALGPECQGLGADADGAHMVELLRQQRLEAGAQVAGLHYQRVAAGDQHIGDLRVGAQVVTQPARLPGGDSQVLVADELGPAEAEGAIAVADLAGAGKKQHRLPVLVLDAFDPLAVQLRDVVLQLTGGVRIEGVANLGHQRIQLGRRPRRARATRSKCSGAIMPRWGKVSWKIGSSGTADQSINWSMTYWLTRKGSTLATTRMSKRCCSDSWRSWGIWSSWRAV